MIGILRVWDTQKMIARLLLRLREGERVAALSCADGKWLYPGARGRREREQAGIQRLVQLQRWNSHLDGGETWYAQLQGQRKPGVLVNRDSASIVKAQTASRTTLALLRNHVNSVDGMPIHAIAG